MTNALRTLMYITLCSASLHSLSQDSLPALKSDAPVITIPAYQALFDSSKRWGEFGEDDELGALNLITAQTRVDAAALVATGESVSLANPIWEYRSLRNLVQVLSCADSQNGFRQMLNTFR